MKNLITIFCLLFMLLTIESCKPKYHPGEIDNEADTEGQKFWDSSFSKCDDSYYGVFAPKGKMPSSSKSFVQMKEPYFLTYHRMDEIEFSEADKLNGFVWKGRTTFQPKASRAYVNGKWNDWVNFGGAYPHTMSYIEVRKIHGVWEFGKPEDDRFFAVPCDEVPK